MFAGSLKKLRDSLVALAYPQACRVCGEPVEVWSDGVVCGRCWTDPAVTRLLLGVRICQLCGAPLDSAIRSIRWSSGPASDDAPRNPERPAACAVCAKVGSRPLRHARSCGIYSGALEASVLFLKSNPHLCGRLREILSATFDEHRDALAGSVVIPVPLHRSRERERGFNQALIIARALCRRHDLPLDARALARVKPTARHRAGMDFVDRAKSVENAFEAIHPARVDGKKILLVDDVYTTGSTISAAATALLRAGAETVNALTLARVASA